MNNPLEKQTALATRWSTITELASRVVLPVVNMVLARLLTPDAFGVVATITMIVSFAELFADAGFQKYIIQHDFKNNDELDQNTNVAFWTNLTLSSFLWVLIFLFSEQLANLVGNPGLGNVVTISSLSIPLVAFSSIQMARFKRDMDFRTLFFVRLVSICVPIFLTIPLALITHNFWALILGTLAGNFANAVVLNIYSNWKPKLYYSFHQLKQMFSYSWWILLESITTWLTAYSDTFIVSVTLSAYYVGLYKTSMVTVNQIMGVIVAAASAPLFVTLSRLQNDKPCLERTYNSYMRSLAFFIFPLSVGIWMYRDFITLVLLGDQWLEASDFIGLWGLLSSVALVFGTFTNGLYNAVGKTYLSFIVSLLNLIIMIPLLVWATPRGFTFLYVSRSLLRVSFVIIQLVSMSCFLKFPVMTFLKSIIPISIPSIIMFVCGYLLKTVAQTMVMTILSIGVCVIVYLCSARLLFPHEFKQSFKLLGFSSNKI